MGIAIPNMIEVNINTLGTILEDAVFKIFCRYPHNMNDVLSDFNKIRSFRLWAGINHGIINKYPIEGKFCVDHRYFPWKVYSQSQLFLGRFDRDVTLSILPRMIEKQLRRIEYFDVEEKYLTSEDRMLIKKIIDGLRKAILRSITDDMERVSRYEFKF